MLQLFDHCGCPFLPHSQLCCVLLRWCIKPVKSADAAIINRLISCAVSFSYHSLLSLQQRSNLNIKQLPCGGCYKWLISDNLPTHESSFIGTSVKMSPPGLGRGIALQAISITINIHARSEDKTCVCALNFHCGYWLVCKPPWGGLQFRPIRQERNLEINIHTQGFLFILFIRQHFHLTQSFLLRFPLGHV